MNAATYGTTGVLVNATSSRCTGGSGREHVMLGTHVVVRDSVSHPPGRR